MSTIKIKRANNIVKPVILPIIVETTNFSQPVLQLVLQPATQPPVQVARPPRRCCGGAH